VASGDVGNCRIHDWSNLRIALLTELWLAGVTGGEIGRQMGVSRSAVMGKLRRLDMLRRDRPRMPVRRVARLLKTEQAIPVPKPAPEKVPNKRHLRQNKRPLPPPEPYQAPPPPPEPAIGSFSLLDLRHGQCRWPGPEDRPPWSFCGARQAFDSSYCPAHHALAHNRGSQRDYDRMAAQALGGKLFASRAGIEQ
jgi:GcrA cell cycle regulator